MEKLINSIPQKKLMSVNKETGEEIFAGLCLRFSSSRGMWICGYGASGGNTTYKSEAYDPVEALASFIELHNKQIS